MSEKHIHLEFCIRLFNLGIPLLRLWQTDLIDGKAVCCCYKRLKCLVPGKHLRYLLPQSVIRSIQELEEWVAQGGNVGIAIHFKKRGAPPNPLRICCFDDDDGKARAWLAERGINSPWMVKGRRGWHLYCLLFEEVPDLDTRINPFKGDPIKMDVKTSGLMVLPMDNGKQLMVDGQDVSSETVHLLDRFNSLDAIRAWLPYVDPRTVIPGMKNRYPTKLELDRVGDEEELSEDVNEDNEPTKITKRAKKSVGPLYLSAVEPPEESYHSNYWAIPYGERRRLAESHAKNLLPSVEGKKPRGKLVKVINDCIHQYGMSDRTTWEIVRDVFNPRCKHADGSPYPWRKSEVVTAIGWAHKEGSYSTMGKLTKLANREKVINRLKNDGLRANARRAKRAREWILDQQNEISMALQELGYITVNPDSGIAYPSRLLLEGSMRFKDLYAELEQWMTEHDTQTPSRKTVGAWLGGLGLDTYKGKIMEHASRHQDAA